MNKGQISEEKKNTNFGTVCRLKKKGKKRVHHVKLLYRQSDPDSKISESPIRSSFLVGFRVDEEELIHQGCKLRLLLGSRSLTYI